MFIVQKFIDRGHSDHYNYGREKNSTCIRIVVTILENKMSFHIRTVPEYSKSSLIVNT